MTGAPTVWDAAVVGGGPAGSTAAAELSAGGARVVLFDYRRSSGKPCSGFLLPRVFDYPPLRGFNRHHPFTGPRIYTSPRGHTFTIAPQQAITPFELSDRRDFDEFLLDRATAAGAVRIKEKVIGVERGAGGWNLVTARRRYQARLLLGADGARSLVRKATVGPLDPCDVIIGIGRTCPDREQPGLHTFFLKNGGLGFLLPGYGFAQIVLGLRLSRAGNLLRRFHAFQASCANGWPVATPVWTALQPSPFTREFFRRPAAGADFCLIGDAAGHCDPLNGEGIPYAMQGAREAAAAILAGDLASYEQRWRDRYGRHFEKAAARLRRTPRAAWLQDLASWSFSHSPSLLAATAAGLAADRSPGRVLGNAMSRLPRIVWEIAQACAPGSATKRKE